MKHSSLVLLLGVILLSHVSAITSNGRWMVPRNDDVTCETDDYNGRSPPNVGSVRDPQRQRDVAPDDDDGVIDDPSDDDYLRYENPKENAICLLQRGKCPNGEWKVFKRQHGTVCLKLFGTPNVVDRQTAGKICRQHSNARLMMIDNHKEREWLHSLPFHNGSFHHVLLAGYRARHCTVNPFLPECKPATRGFVNEDGTANPEYAFSVFTNGPLNAQHEGGRYDDCPVLHYLFSLEDRVNVVRDLGCINHHLFLCGVTIM